jgi:uncharacterized membrane protein (DUF106 family)
MKKKNVIMLVATLIIGIIIGGLAMGIYSHHKLKSMSEPSSKDKFKQRIEHMLNPDEAQLKQIEPSLDKFSDNAYSLLKDHQNKMYNTFDSLYITLKPLLKEEQSQKFEKRLNHFKTEISK